jgi:hypothetical protein
MDLKPFVQLAAPRVVNRPELPPELAEFYSGYEGVGLGSSTDRPVRLCRLEELALLRSNDLFTLEDGVPEGWEGFAAVRVGVGMFGDQILYVIHAPSCPPGSILAIGRDLAGPGGDGPFRMASTLVLAESFPGWLAHLERWGWVEYAVAGWVAPPDPQAITRYYLALNPGMNVGRAEPGSAAVRGCDPLLHQP